MLSIAGLEWTLHVKPTRPPYIGGRIVIKEVGRDVLFRLAAPYPEIPNKFVKYHRDCHARGLRPKWLSSSAIQNHHRRLHQSSLFMRQDQKVFDSSDASNPVQNLVQICFIS